MPVPLPQDFFHRPPIDVARELIGATLLVDSVGGIIVETEAYDRQDPASHTYQGLTRRNAAMFGPGGSAYVYRSYGIHWCLNFVCLPASAVLVRALEPTEGLALMQARRGVTDPRQLCGGPGRLCQALGVTAALDGRPLDQPPFAVLARGVDPPIAAGPRIGISKGVETPWRFCLRGSRFPSRGGGFS